mmetsp:Transcript_2897/g.7884  ORF Transcript_2897/g.7884 Transcript_2897/m.7884 type:complete len:257 (+) Transcript_2897:362-1132(+)
MAGLVHCHCLLMISFLLLLSTTTNQRSGFASGWVFSPHTATIRNANARVENLSPFPRSKPCLRQDFRDDDTGDEMEFFDDFGFVVGGDSSEQSAEEGISPSNPNQGSSSFSVLQQRFEQVALIEQGNKQQISDNWKEGYWGVWGCSLDPYTGETSEKTVVTCVRKMPPTPGEDSDNNDDGDGDDDEDVCYKFEFGNQATQRIRRSRRAHPTRKLSLPVAPHVHRRGGPAGQLGLAQRRWTELYHPRLKPAHSTVLW